MKESGIGSQKVIRRKRDGELEYLPDELTIEEPLEIRVGRKPDRHYDAHTWSRRRTRSGVPPFGGYRSRSRSNRERFSERRQQSRCGAYRRREIETEFDANASERFPVVVVCVGKQASTRSGKISLRYDRLMFGLILKRCSRFPRYCATPKAISRALAVFMPPEFSTWTAS